MMQNPEVMSQMSSMFSGGGGGLGNLASMFGGGGGGAAAAGGAEGSGEAEAGASAGDPARADALMQKLEVCCSCAFRAFGPLSVPTMPLLCRRTLP